MSTLVSQLEDTGLEVVDILSDSQFAERKLHTRDVPLQMVGMQRLGQALVDNPATILDELVKAAVDLCGADSAGISIERENGTDRDYYHWVATAGVYSGFLNAVLPRYPSACGITLQRGGPQMFRVSKRFFDILGVEAPLVTDGILLPWTVDGTRGTIFVMAHGRTEAFDMEDAKMMQTLANFAAMGYRQQRQQKKLIEQERSTAASDMANHLAHRINNPLQTITNLVYLAARDKQNPEAQALATHLESHVERLSGLVAELLALPFRVKKEDPKIEFTTTSRS